MVIKLQSQQTTQQAAQPSAPAPTTTTTATAQAPSDAQPQPLPGKALSREPSSLQQEKPNEQTEVLLKELRELVNQLEKKNKELSDKLRTAQLVVRKLKKANTSGNKLETMEEVEEDEGLEGEGANGGLEEEPTFEKAREAQGGKSPGQVEEDVQAAVLR